MVRSNKKKPRQNNEPRGILLNEVKPKTQNQANYIDSILDNTITVCAAPSGSGKTYLAIGRACHALANGEIDQIVVCRSIIGCGKEIGLLPGDVDQKVHAYFLAVLEYLEYFIDRSIIHNMIKQGVIKLMPIELIRGHTYNKTWMILEEAQNCDLKQLKLFMSRIGYKSKIIISGDEKQSDIRGSCMPFLMNNFNHIDDFKVVRMDYSDILRHPIIPDILEIFDKQGI